MDWVLTNKRGSDSADCWLRNAEDGVTLETRCVWRERRTNE